ncbi:hypothetical protein Krac_3952 [Ktedonobacter racemifer DSM 44963]|uniref:Uncharacterized protein n=1 Tax=Ktedonobacter racemifer DSM 44963 TaxID=485913 RepID=D6U3Q0_KTERA|nr:hypothetical protein Krac_3952 [Ktedonobacter racemifer DSM 44963]
MWRIVSDARQSGILWINGAGTALITLGYSFIGIIWSITSLVYSLREYRQKEPHAKKSAILWAIILLGANILVIASVLVVCLSPLCVDDGSYNGNSTCGLTVPGIVIPTPTPMP